MNAFSSEKILLRWLGRVTAVAIAGILLLQGYWLVSSYREQQVRFRADIEQALRLTVLQRQLAESFSQKLPGQYGNLLSSLVSDVLINATQDGPVDILTLHIANADLEMDSTDAADLTDALRPLLKELPELTKHRAGRPVGDESVAAMLNSYAAQLRMELQRRSIETSTTLALVNSQQKVILIAGDSVAFYQAAQKTKPVRINTGPLGAGNYIQAGFPHAGLFLLRRMAWLLTITGLLAVICCVSFVWLLRLFHSHKRNADMRTDFMNNMTHELKTPITGVSIALQLIRDKRQPIAEAGQAEYLAIAEGELNRLSGLLDKILHMAAFEKSEIVLSPSAFSAGALIEEVTGSTRPLLEAAGARLATSIVPEELTLYADRTHLALVLHNLVENAVKYSDKPTPEISVSLSRSDAGIQIAVADNGKGIPQHYLGRVFDKFFRVPGGDLHDIKGHGLGLSYVKAIVDLHGGQISVISTPGTGTTFSIEIPKR